MLRVGEGKKVAYLHIFFTELIRHVKHLKCFRYPYACYVRFALLSVPLCIVGRQVMRRNELSEVNESSWLVRSLARFWPASLVVCSTN